MLDKYRLPNLKHALSQAFWNGFWQGFPGADPDDMDWRELEKSFPELPPLMPLTQDATEGTRLVWETVGKRIQKALNQYEQEK